MISFKRWINPINLKYMKDKYGAIFNVNSISYMRRFSIWKIFRYEDKKIVNEYMFYVLNEYAKKNYETTLKFSQQISKIIRKLKLVLNDSEEEEIRLLNERVFSTERHIKKLKSNLRLANGEAIGIKFIDGELYVKTRKLKIITKADILVSNKRIIFNDKDSETNFYWKNISNNNLQDYGYEFLYKKKTYVIRIHDQETFANTIDNYLAKINVS